MKQKRTSRRRFLMSTSSLLATVVVGCSASTGRRDYKQLSQSKIIGYSAKPIDRGASNREASLPKLDANYGPLGNERFPIPQADLSQVSERFLRREVSFPSEYPTGTLVVDTTTFYLHLIGTNGMAMRYGVGLGRAGFSWSGRGVIKWKKAWPTWTPPAEMIARDPSLVKWGSENGGMPPGLKNPLGARALYIFQNDKDTLYRLHGTPEYWSIGKSVSSGCVRLMNHDIIDLYRRVKNGATLIVS